MQLMFGIGALWGKRTDIANVGPDQFAVLQDNTIDFDFEVKELYSQLGFPIDIARGKGKISGKAKMARVFANLYADLFFGETVATGENTVSQDEVFTLAGGLYTAANAATFLTDLGGYYNPGTAPTAARQRFQFVTGAPSAGQYSTGTTGGPNGTGDGHYTFNTGDNGQSLAFSYVYNIASPTGHIFTINNHFMGYTPTFSATFYTSRTTLNSSGQLTLRLNECISSRLTFPSRIDDYNIPDFDWAAFSDGSNVIGSLSTTE